MGLFDNVQVTNHSIAESCAGTADHYESKLDDVDLFDLPVFDHPGVLLLQIVRSRPQPYSPPATDVKRHGPGF